MAQKVLIYSDMHSAPWGGSEVLWSQLMERSGQDVQFGLICYSSSKTRDICRRHSNTPACLVPEYLAAHCRTWVKRILRKATGKRDLQVGHKLSLMAQRRFVDRFRPDVVFVSLPWPLGGKDLWTHLNPGRVPYVCFLHSMAPEYMTAAPSRELVAFYRRAHRVLTTGQRSSLLLQEWLGTRLDNVLPTHNFVDCSKFRGTAEAKPWPVNGPRMVSVGRFSHEKGYDILIRALAPMKDVPWTLDLVGAGPLQTEIAASVRQLGLQDRVRFLGPMDASRMPEILREHDIFVLPSRIEGMPLSLLEAMASSLACVATDVGSIREVLIHDTSGILVPPGNENALRSALLRLAGNQAQCVRLGLAARDAVVSQCDEEPFLANVLRILLEAASPGSRRQEAAAVPCPAVAAANANWAQ